MGHKPCAITYSSHYFQKLYDLGVELIKIGKAYVDHQTPDQVRKYFISPFFSECSCYQFLLRIFRSKRIVQLRTKVLGEIALLKKI